MAFSEELAERIRQGLARRKVIPGPDDAPALQTGAKQIKGEWCGSIEADARLAMIEVDRHDVSFRVVFAE